MGGGGQTKTTEVKNENHDPWAAQQPYLTGAFAEAKNIYDNSKDDPAYTGDFVAGMRPEAVQNFQDALGHSANTAATGGMMTGMAPGLTGAGAGGLFNLAGDQTDATVANAGKYAANPFMDGMVDAAMRDSRRSVAEQAMPGIERDAAGTGNINSTRRGIAEGIVQRGLAEKTADVSASLRGDAYKTGLGMAGDDLARRLQASTALGGLGISSASAGGDLSQKGLDGSVLASQMLQGADQVGIDNGLQAYDYNTNRDWNQLGNLWNVVGDKSWGGTVTGASTSTTKNTPSTLSTLGSGLAVMGSLFRCDARVKNIISKVGQSAHGFGLYLFTYKGDPTERLHVAPMAQEVELTHPEAVVEIDGIKHINVNAL